MKPTLIISIILLSVLSFSCSSDDDTPPNYKEDYWNIKFTSYVYSESEMFNNKNVFEVSKYYHLDFLSNREYLKSIYDREYLVGDYIFSGDQVNNHAFEMRLKYKETDRDKVDKYIAKYFPSYLDCTFFYIEHEVSEIKWVKMSS
ncbi:hypothetical protein LJC28_00705 [Dysgonomonas sp. OttesenSCG-928-D17]|nr:hypothetical protein [Dysgonomonas sp. OttesenSCG-928-D17]